jgi:radical SAM superfamily enzyme YgiQ (UPF0313 family)
MKVMLMTTPRPKEGDSPLHFGCGRPPQGLGFIAAFLEKAGHKVEIVDLYTFGGEGIVGDSTSIQHIGTQLDIDLDYKIKSFQPDFIGMHISSITHINAYELSARLAKDYPKITQVCGGPHPTLFPDEVPGSFSYAVKGAGEFAMLNIVEDNPIAGSFSEQSVFVMDGGCIPSNTLNTFPFPDYDKFINLPYNYGLDEFGIDDKALILSTSRGCPYSCKFCAGKYVHPNYSKMGAYAVVSEMHKLKKKYDVSTFYFREDNFTASRKRLTDFCNLLLLTSNRAKFKWVCESRARGLTPEIIELMAQAGCIGLYIGCESGSDRMLRLMHKGEKAEHYEAVFPVLKANGINTYTTWMFGFPGERGEDAGLTERLIAKLEPTSVDRFIFIGIPISDMYRTLDASGHYEYKDKYGFIFPYGYFEKATALYGKNDPKVKYVRDCYGHSLHTS